MALPQPKFKIDCGESCEDSLLNRPQLHIRTYKRPKTISALQDFPCKESIDVMEGGTVYLPVNPLLGSTPSVLVAPTSHRGPVRV